MRVAPTADDFREVEVVCSRCSVTVTGLESRYGTCGFYRLTGVWQKYQRVGEQVLCDMCMQNDARYRMDYVWTKETV